MPTWTRAIRVAAVCLALVLPRPGHAQREQNAAVVREHPITIMLVDSLGGADISAVLLRRRTGGDVVVLRAGDAQADRLALAVTMLVKSAGESSLPMLRDSRIVIRGHAAPRGVPHAWLARANAVMAQLRASPEREVAGAGRGRAREVTASWLRPPFDAADADGGTR
jgi:hypothetical protein